MRRKMVRRSAFTLMEVLMVAAILALLAAFAVPALMKQGSQAKVDLTKSQVGNSGTISQQLDKYRFDVGRYPDTSEGLAALYERPSSIDEESGKWKGPYLKGSIEQLRDPFGAEYEYKSPGEFNEDSFDLWSVGEDGEDGTDDDVGNWVKK